MVSQTAEYALRAMVFLALAYEEPCTGHQIADACRVSPGYMAKVLHTLTRAGLVSSQRGLGGGFRLTRSPEQITILEVVNVIDPVQRITRCPLGIHEHQKLCPLHRQLDEAAAHIEQVLGGVTLADLLRDPKSRPLCGAADQVVNHIKGQPLPISASCACQANAQVSANTNDTNAGRVAG